MFLTIDVRLQMAGVTLAEEMNFTRAADRLKITQPALSKQTAENQIWADENHYQQPIKDRNMSNTEPAPPENHLAEGKLGLNSFQAVAWLESMGTRFLT